MGNEQVTIENLDVVKVDAELNMIVIRGAIPGPKGGLVYIRNTVKNNKVKNVELGISKNPQKASGTKSPEGFRKRLRKGDLKSCLRPMFMICPASWLARSNSPKQFSASTPNESVVHDVVKNHLANKRQGTQSALTRAEVSGGGRKPWRQKGTGRARQGSTRAPQWTHGGIVFAPKPRDPTATP